MKASRLSVLAFGLAILAAAVAPAKGEESVDVELADCPAAVQKTLKEEARGGRIEAVSKETDEGKTSYFADVVIGGKSYGISVAEDGVLNEFSFHVDDHQIGLTDCPEAVQKTIREAAKGAKIRDVSRELNLGVKVFTTEFESHGKRYKIMVTEDGTLTEKILLIEEDEIALSDCPAAVQKTFNDESKDGTLKALIRSSGIGKPVYMADLDIKGASYHLVVFEDGTLVSKTIEGSE